jgi:hypothetical protein
MDLKLFNLSTIQCTNVYARLNPETLNFSVNGVED